MIWTMRYRQPKGLGIVQLETLYDNQADAEALGRKYVAEQPSPAYRFISVERSIVASDVAEKRALKAEAKPDDPTRGDLRPKAVPAPKAKSAAPATEGRIGG